MHPGLPPRLSRATCRRQATCVLRNPRSMTLRGKQSPPYPAAVLATLNTQQRRPSSSRICAPHQAVPEPLAYSPVR